MVSTSTTNVIGYCSGSATSRTIIVGSGGNTWIWSPEGWDLTHPANPSAELPIEGVRLDCELTDVKIDPIKTALVIVDMQNIGLNKALDPPSAPPMYEAQDAILKYAIPAAQKLGLQVIWLNWGLTEDDLANIPPAEVRVFAFDVNTTEVDDYGLGECHYYMDPLIEGVSWHFCIK
ncbi:hypothetical protein O1611_g1677 [Lasiodiplodia mahajangana]|uniref:Uncharacterized protein n=1 Tax=Lasiodiplodia mahajangana TaxID=1108764 RepID=A0ACC2JWP8_9PEZI|nr:hypothetical protein O1611_g1677 [Lasiodiplodia mahajangana]